MSIENESDLRHRPKNSIGAIGALGRGLNYDFCPQVNDYVYWLKKPFGWVICGAAFSGLVGLFIGPQGYVLMGSLIALLVIGSVWPWLGMKGLDCTLRFKDARTHEGEPASAILEIRNRWPIPLFGLMVEGEFLQDVKNEDDKIAVGLQRIPGWSVCQFELEFEPRRRGMLPIETPMLANGFPFGIYRSEKEVEIIDQTIVWPQRKELAGQPNLEGEQFNIEGLMSDRFGDIGEIIGVRNFREGDSLRNVHWQKTAASRELVVKERQTCAQKPIQILLDLTPSTHCGSESQSSYEWAIRVAANLCRQLHRGHSHIEVLCQGLPKSIVSRETNQRGMTPLLDFFATLPQLASLSQASESKGSYQIVERVQTVVVCTSKSKLISTMPQQAIPIVLSANGFQDPDELIVSSESVDADASELAGAYGAIPVMAPETGLDELYSGWESYCENS